MSKKCIWCGGEVNPNVIQGMYYCPRCDEDLTDQDVLPMTVFDKITENVETLADLLVYIIRCEEDPTWTEWGSNIVQGVFETREEAVAATIEELKKEVEDE